MSERVTVLDLISSQDTFQTAKAIVASNLALAATLIAVNASPQGVGITENAMKSAVQKAKQIFDLSVSTLPRYKRASR